jgi:hypothetical protein
MRRFLIALLALLAPAACATPRGVPARPEAIVFVTVENDRMDWATVYDARGRRLGQVTSYTSARFRLTQQGLTSDGRATFTVRYLAGKSYRSDVAQVWPGAHVVLRLASTNPEPWLVVRR